MLGTVAEFVGNASPPEDGSRRKNPFRSRTSSPSITRQRATADVIIAR